MAPKEHASLEKAFQWKKSINLNWITRRFFNMLSIPVFFDVSSIKDKGPRRTDPFERYGSRYIVSTFIQSSQYYYSSLLLLLEVVGSIYGWSPFWKLVLTYIRRAAKTFSAAAARMLVGKICSQEEETTFICSMQICVATGYKSKSTYPLHSIDL